MAIDVSNQAEAPGKSGAAEPYSLLVFPFPPGHFRVRSFRGVERLSRPYAFDVTVLGPLVPEVEIERLALGQRAVFVVRVADSPRAIHGVVASVHAEGARAAHDAAQFRLRIVPRLALLRHARTSRIFQDATVPEVINGVLRAAGIATRWQLAREYPKHAYITQYQETTLAFIERLLAEAGIFYAFVQPLSLLQHLEDLAEGALAGLGPLGVAGAAAGGLASALLEPETVVFGDDPAAYVPIDDGSALATAIATGAALGAPVEVGVGPVNVGLPSPTLTFDDRAGLSTTLWDKVTHFTARHAVRSNAAEFRDYDPDRPQLGLVARAPDAGAGLSLSVAGVAVGVSADVKIDPTKGVSASLDLTGALPQPELEAYEHHGNFHYPTWKDAQVEADRVLRARRRRADGAAGASRCPSLAPGARFMLDGHPISTLNREYVVTKVRHRGAVGAATEIYTNEFECVRANVLYPPKKPSRPHVSVALTATVIGPGGEEIWVDGAGRIQVRFHWDRDGVGTCWLRTMQAWGGAGWGTQFIPRVGMEVVVAFDGGDPDRPIVLGSIYNGTHPVPFQQPVHKTQSGVRTRSSPGGGGYNELMFEDGAGREQIHLRAQRDLDEVVGRNHTLQVVVDETVKVDGDRRDTVGRNARYRVNADREEVVLGDVKIQHGGSRVDVVERSLDQRVSGVRTTRVEGRDDLEVRDVAEQRYLSDFTSRVSGNHTIVVGKHEAPRSLTFRVEGVGISSTEDVLELSSNKGITLRCGETSVRIGADGIELSGGIVRVAGEKGVLEAGKHGLRISTDGVTAQLGDKVLVQTDQASMSMGSEVRLDGTKILLNSPDKATDDPPPEKKPPTDIELKDRDGRPLARQRFVIDLDDGSQRTGVTDDEGKASLDLPSGGKIRFPELSGVTPA